MSLQNILKRKVGGTLVGNLIRKTVNQATNGVLGNGAMMISQKEYDQKNLVDSDYLAKYGQSKTGVPIANFMPMSQQQKDQIKSIEQQSDENIDKSIKQSKFEAIKCFIKKYWIYISIPVVLTAVIIAFKKINFKRKRKY